MWSDLSNTFKIALFAGCAFALTIIGLSLYFLINEAKKDVTERRLGIVFWGLAMSAFGIVIFLLTLVAVAVLHSSQF